jgi:hypothetical protein
MKTSELTGAALDWAVARCEGVINGDGLDVGFILEGGYSPSTDWAQGGPIIEREEIDTSCIEGPEDLKWEAIKLTKNGRSVFCFKGPTPLIAAMRTFVASKLGDEVEIPVELTKGE